ncbi:MAG: hypothetical protein AB7G15_08510 [Alphaproteobacteria bacterium]
MTTDRSSTYVFRAVAALPARAVPDELIVTGGIAAGPIMALRHRSLPLAAVQFHPESILTQSGGHSLALIFNAVRLLADDRGHAGAGLRRAASDKSG